MRILPTRQYHSQSTAKGPEWCHRQVLNAQFLNGRRDSSVVRLAIACGDQNARFPKRLLEKRIQLRTNLLRSGRTNRVSILLNYQTPGGLALIDEGDAAYVTREKRGKARGC